MAESRRCARVLHQAAAARREERVETKEEKNGVGGLGQCIRVSFQSIGSPPNRSGMRRLNEHAGRHASCCAASCSNEE
ncbi:hypothetical protein TRIUR3_30358 [Triticum urartu]|uniref:Uncharacterized protein n=1 Tax=Triticum urartu TaxID=4572 RepID=M7Z9G6_TRIUA|nr:hypothetical protein TRIUR3_30358 [Triticum urartu]